MTPRSFLRALVASAVVLSLLAIAAPASAQMGSLRGRVVDANGKPVDRAQLVFEFLGDIQRRMDTLTDRDGIWVRAGLASGRWKITVTKEKLTAVVEEVTVVSNQMSPIKDIIVRAPGEKGPVTAPAMSAEEVAAHNKRAVELDKLFKDANAALSAGNLDEAIIKLEAIAKEVEKCAPCYGRIGDVYQKKGDLANAEKAYLQAIEFKPDDPDPYKALATIYNTQRKFDEAVKMSSKANELLGASGGADAASTFNQGIIYWNASKVPEALAQFEKAIKLDPAMADAHYWYGMALVNQGKTAAAKAPFQEYLKLAPTGQYAATAKAVLDTIK
jgi:tetratricopeptide (TPR) repeat protein